MVSSIPPQSGLKFILRFLLKTCFNAGKDSQGKYGSLFSIMLVQRLGVLLSAMCTRSVILFTFLMLLLRALVMAFFIFYSLSVSILRIYRYKFHSNNGYLAVISRLLVTVYICLLSLLVIATVNRPSLAYAYVIIVPVYTYTLLLSILI